MKKNFFKKLSFVMALAMIISVINPAAGAFAAAKAPKFNSTKEFLYLDRSGDNKFDFNISTKQAGWKYAWSSSNKKVATINSSNGVATATGAGTAKVTLVIKDKNKKQIAKLTASVIVRDNIKDLKISNAPTEAIKVGEAKDLNRSYTTEAGKTSGSESKTLWFVDSEKASIDKMGVFTATEAGEYKVTARAFQSTEKANLYLDDAEKNAKYVLDSDEVTIKVNASITAVKVVTPKQIEITFDSTVKAAVDGKEDVTVNLKLNDSFTQVYPVKSFDSISADGKTVTVTLWDSLIHEKTYKVSAANASFEVFAQIGKPVSISMENQTIPSATSTRVSYKLLDQYGVNVAEDYDGVVSMTTSIPFDTGKKGYLTLANNQVAFVEYSYVLFDATTGAAQVLSTGVKTVTGTNATVGAELEWNLISGVTPSADWTKTTKTVALKTASVWTIFGRAKKSDGSYTATTDYTYTSLNESVLLIDKYTDRVIPLAVGTALVKVTDLNGSLVTYINVTVTGEAATSFVEASKTSITLSNAVKFGTATAAAPDSISVTIKNVDQYGNKVDADEKESYFASASKSKSTEFVTASVSGNVVTFTAIAGKTGSALFYFLTTEDKYATVSVTVGAPGAVANYEIVASETAIDSYVGNADTSNSVTFEVYGVDASGYRAEKMVSSKSVTGQTIGYEITGPNNFKEVKADDANGVVTFATDDTAVLTTNKANGTYTFTVSINGIKYSKTFEVQNTRTGLTATVNSKSCEIVGGDVLTAVKSMITTKVGSTQKYITGVEFISTDSSVVASSTAVDKVGTFLRTGAVSVFVQKVIYVESGVTYTADINDLFTITVK